MSRAFVKEDSGEGGDPVVRQASGRPNYVTPAGLEALKAKTAGLGWKRAELVSKQRVDELRSLELRQVEADLKYYEERLKKAILVDNRGLQVQDARFGATVSVREPDGTLKDYVIVGEDEADPKAGRINWGSPLAAALMGAAAGARVAVSRKGGAVQIEVLSVSYPKD